MQTWEEAAEIARTRQITTDVIDLQFTYGDMQDISGHYHSGLPICGDTLAKIKRDMVA